MALCGIARGVANLKVFHEVHTNEKIWPLLYGKRCPVDPFGSLGKNKSNILSQRVWVIQFSKEHAAAILNIAEFQTLAKGRFY